MATTCAHEQLCLGPSTHAPEVGYTRRTRQELLAATHPSGRVPKSTEGGSSDSSTFPSPLVLPGNDLSWDPKYDPQSLKSWLKEGDRNPVTEERKTIYVAPVPSVAAKVKYVKEWTQPKLSGDTAKKEPIARPNGADVVQYLSAFYTNLPVKSLSNPKLQFMSWDDDQPAKKRSKVSYVALAVGSEAVRIRARPSSDGIFPQQLNLEDILDAAISILPSDAYALLLLVDHDMYEEEDNDFCCGRAYGGSRVAIVSSARYNPMLDAIQQVEREHAWPASHCRKYVDTYVKNATESEAPRKKKTDRRRSKTRHTIRPPQCKRPSELSHRYRPLHSQKRLYGLLDYAERRRMSLVTASAWITACTTPAPCRDHLDLVKMPDNRPVDLAKMQIATSADLTERYRALLVFCERFEGRERTFTAFAAWLRHRVLTAEKKLS